MVDNSWREQFAERGVTAFPVQRASDRLYAPVSESCHSVRVQLAGSFLLALANHPSTTPLERNYRKLPRDGIFAASPERPNIIELGVFSVPQQMVLLILDWRFDIYRPSGAAVGDVVPLEDRRLALSIGWDVTFDARRVADVQYEITPAPAPNAVTAYESNPNAGFIPSNGPLPRATDADFERVRFLRTQSPSSVGAGMMPQRHRRDVQPEMPFTYVVEANQVVQFNVIAFQPVTIPIAFFEAEFSGLIVGSNAFKEFLKNQNPCVGVGG